MSASECAECTLSGPDTLHFRCGTQTDTIQLTSVCFNQVFHPIMKKLLLLFMAVFALAASAAAQSRTVTGTVVGAEDDEPLVGATVLPVGGAAPARRPTSTAISP